MKDMLKALRQAVPEDLQLFRPLIVLDLETTGVNVRQDKIIELALVKLHTDKHVRNTTS